MRFPWMQAGYMQLLIDGIKFDFIDCELDMVSNYQKFGYKLIFSVYHKVYGTFHIMILDVLNFDVLQKIESPYRHIYRSFLESKNI